MVTADNLKDMRIAFVHDWLTGIRGGERVLEELIQIFGPRDLYTLVCDYDKISGPIADCRITTSFLQNFPGCPGRHQWWLPLFPLAIESFDFSEYDLVISTSHCVAKGIVTRPATFHYCYLFTPVRYAWDFSTIYGQAAKPRWLMKRVWPVTMSYLRQWDVTSSNRVDHFCSISEYVARRVNKYYRRDSEVILPPVDLSRFFAVPDRSDYYFVLSALVPYKRIDLAIEACKLLNRRLIVAGQGPEEERLRRLAEGGPIEFVGRVSDSETVALYQKSKGFLFPGEEDYGITPLEAQACGIPVVAYGAGGALETVLDSRTGVFFAQQTAESMADAILRLESLSLKASDCVEQAARFSPQSFRTAFLASIANALSNRD